MYLLIQNLAHLNKNKPFFTFYEVLHTRSDVSFQEVNN